jgi:hypothetical protein
MIPKKSTYWRENIGPEFWSVVIWCHTKVSFSGYSVDYTDNIHGNNGNNYTSSSWNYLNVPCTIMFMGLTDALMLALVYSAMI